MKLPDKFDELCDLLDVCKKNFFDIILENNQVYRMEVGFNFHEYTIKKGFLYKGFKKLGKVRTIKETDL